MGDYLDTVLAMQREYEKNELDEKRVAVCEPADAADVQRLNWNPVLECPWLPQWWCSCGASVGGEWPECPACGGNQPEPIPDLLAISLGEGDALGWEPKELPHAKEVSHGA
jgi:hypothetical protein